MTHEQKEELRHAVLAVLAIRHPAALPLPAIRRHVVREGITHFEAADLESALQILHGLNFTQSIPDPLGSTECWSATAAGVLHFERNGGR